MIFKVLTEAVFCTLSIEIASTAFNYILIATAVPVRGWWYSQCFIKNLLVLHDRSKINHNHKTLIFLQNGQYYVFIRTEIESLFILFAWRWFVAYHWMRYLCISSFERSIQIFKLNIFITHTYCSLEVPHLLQPPSPQLVEPPTEILTLTVYPTSCNYILWISYEISNVK